MPATFKRLLLATEHGEFDAGAEALAFAMARRCAVPLAGVLPILSNPEFEVVAPQLAERADAQAAVKREDLLAQAQAAGVALALRLRRGAEPYAEIVEEAHAVDADLIVIRRRGHRSFLANLLLGEIVSKVVAHSPCCVLIAARRVKMWSRRMLVGLDPQRFDVAMLATAAALAVEYGLPLLVVCVAGSEAGRQSAQQAVTAALQQLREAGADAEGEVRIGRPHQELIDAARARGADLLVIGRHGSEPLGRAWIGGAAQKVVGLAECPVLIHVNTPQPI